MKLIKKIAAIMFAFMMVFSLSTNVKAENGVNTSQGSITISNVKKGETYKIYRILDLDSYNYPTENPKGGNYSYTYKQGDKNATEWKNFIDHNTGDGKYFKKTDSTVSKYFTANDGVKGEDIAKAALKYVQDNTTIEADGSYTASEDGTYTFNNLPLGYYLVESTVSALCSLDTTNPNQTIEVKYEVPTVTKKIIDTEGLVSNTTAKIGDPITYHVTIPVKKGATNYVFHDELETGLKYYKNPQAGNKFSVAVDSTQAHTNGTQGVDYTLTLNANENAFTIKFEDSFLQKINVGENITLTYIAIVAKDAPMNKAINNTAYLNYGNNQKSNESTTSVYTFNIPVFKYTGVTKQGLAGATFNLYKDEKNSNNLLKFDEAFDEANGNVYKYNPKTGVTDLVSDANGNINLNGLSAGTYILEETKAPEGYNKLEKTIKVVVTKGEDGKPVIHVDDDTTSVEKVEVKNSTGSLLPSTGGMGTTLIYLVGGALVLGSGFVLANKKRAKAK